MPFVYIVGRNSQGILTCTALYSLLKFKKGDIFFNYGCFPQTWEDPTFIHPDAEGCRGDNDPLDVCEIGARIVPCGVSQFIKSLFALDGLVSNILLAHDIASIVRESVP
jgi:hypothetical protein